jgi:phage terminase small subunit
MAKKKEEDKITPLQEQFVDIWFNMQFNGKLAYKKLKPNVTNETAEVEASKLLRLPKVQDYIELKREQIRIKEQVELSWVINQLKNIVYDINTNDHTVFDADGKAINKTDHRTKIEALKTLAKIAGLDNHQQKIDVTTNGENINHITWIEKKNYPEKLND